MKYKEFNPEEYSKAYRAKNRGRLLDYDKQRNSLRKNDPAYREKMRISRLAREYKVDSEVATKLYIASMTTCEICGTSWNPDIHTNRFCVDHNHTTGAIRGILCHHCNSALGHVRENNKIIESLLEYNRKYNG